MGIKDTMKETGKKVKTWGEEHPKTVRFSKALLANILKVAVGETPAPALPQVKDGTVLDAAQVRMLSGMTSWQLASIFKGKKVTFAMDPDTLKAVRNLSSWQISAILGEEEEE